MKKENMKTYSDPYMSKCILTSVLCVEIKEWIVKNCQMNKPNVWYQTIITFSWAVISDVTTNPWDKQGSSPLQVGLRWFLVCVINNDLLAKLVIDLFRKCKITRYGFKDPIWLLNKHPYFNYLYREDIIIYHFVIIKRNSTTNASKTVSPFKQSKESQHKNAV